MTESLLDQLLETHYPLTSYLRRQQDFHKFFSSTQTNEHETSLIHRQKMSLPPGHKIPEVINPIVHHPQSEINHDQEAQDDDDGAVQE